MLIDNKIYMLNKTIKNTILEFKEKKENLLIERKLVENRLLIIFGDDKKFEKLSETKKKSIGILVLLETSKMYEEGLISEQFDLLGLFKNLFGGLFSSGVETFVEGFVKNFLSKFGITGFLANSIASIVATRPSDFVRALGDCKLMTTLIAKSLIEGFIMTKQQDFGLGGTFADFFRNQIGGMLNNTEFIKSLEDKMSSTVCSVLDTVSGNAMDMAKKLGIGT